MQQRRQREICEQYKKEQRLAFLETLPTEPKAIKEHILNTQLRAPTDDQVEFWQKWLITEKSALREDLRLI